MKRIILLGLIIISITAKSQTSHSTGSCKAGFRFEVNHEIMTFAPATVLNFYDTSGGKVKEWYWDFGDGSEYVKEQNPIHIFNHPLEGPNVKMSPYRTVTLTILTDSCKSIYSQTINILDLGDSVQLKNCTALFKYYETGRDTAGGTAKIAFVNNSSGNNLSYFWQFGDGSTSTEKEPVVKFKLGQTEYKVCLTVTGTDSCTNTFCDAVYLQNPVIDSVKCDVAFGYDKKVELTSEYKSVTVDFYSKSYPEAKEWFWNFGDGTTSNEANPKHTYLQKVPFDLNLIDPVPYREVCLTVKTIDDCKISTCQKIDVYEIYQKTDPVCQAHFKYEVTSFDSLNKVAVVQFYNGSQGKDLKFIWQFGDGSTSNEREPLKKFSLSQNEYMVCLVITGADSCNDTYCVPVNLSPVVIIDPVTPECYAAFGYELKDMLMSPLPSMVANFYSKVYPEAKQYYWSFGDGETSNEANPSHAYIKKTDSLSVTSPYREVCLTVETTDGCKVTYCDKVPVFGSVNQNPDSAKCQAAFKYYIPADQVTIPEIVMIKLIDGTAGEVVKRLWQFENGKTSTEKEPLVSFSIFQPVHKVCLTVTLASGCESTFCGEVYIKSPVIGPLPPVQDCPYKIKVDGGFPVQMSSCVGWASAKVYNSDGNEVIPEIYSWSTGDSVSNVSGLCPTKTYTVKALMKEGCVVYAHFILNADGSVTPTSPVNWTLSGMRDNLYVHSDAPTAYQVEWKLCDGTIVKADSIPLDLINCGGSESNYMLKDSLGNLVYSETITLKGSVTGIPDLAEKTEVKIWPNPVESKLNISYSGAYRNEMKIEVLDVMGKLISTEVYSGISGGDKFSIETGRLVSGIYVCRISSAGEFISSQKFSKK